MAAAGMEKAPAADDPVREPPLATRHQGRTAARVKPLAECSDAASLNRAIQELCAELGIVARVDIRTLVESGKRQALCFLRTEPAGQEERLMRTPGATRFGNELLFIVNLSPEVANAKRSADQRWTMTPATTAASSTIQPMQAR
jgi:hypothetical protein